MYCEGEGDVCTARVRVRYSSIDVITIPVTDVYCDALILTQ